MTVVTLEGGNLVLTDPVTTEVAGGALIQFSEISASTQVDAVTTAVDQVMTANLVGVVPYDLSMFIMTVKQYLASVLNSLITTGAIAPYRDASGATRNISLTQDLQVFQSATDATTFDFNYFYMLRYPCKRLMGQFSVDSPFFSS